MNRYLAYLSVATAAVLGPAAAAQAADLYCKGVSDNHPLTVLCEDFDRYCIGSPAWPERCADHSTPDQDAFLDYWPEVAFSDRPMKVDDEWKEDGSPLYADSPPFTGRYYSGDNQYLDTQHNHDLRPDIAAIESGKNIVVGTDLHPLILDFVFHFHDEGRQYYQSQYVDLSLNDGTTLDRAPTDYVLSEDCSLVYGCGDSNGYPIVCQQNNNYQTTCPPLGTLPHHSSIAVGILSWLDTNPCHCGEEVAHAASNWHLVFFDGAKWWTLKSGVPTTGGGTRTPRPDAPEPPPEECKIKSPGDFGLFNGLNHVRLTIRTSKVLVEHWYRQMCKTNNDWKYDIYHWQDIPRVYLGGFNNIALGTALGCELDANGDCVGSRHLLGPNEQGGNGEMDSIALVDGELRTYTAEGACCMENGECQNNMLQTACEAAGGRFQGASTTCEDPGRLCCPSPWADRDADGDVDQMDFGAFQVCYTGTASGLPPGCECFDRDDNDRLDVDDYLGFTQCWTGANVPYKTNPPAYCSP